MNDQEKAEQLQFVEGVAQMYEVVGLPRIAGRILGWLLICDPPTQTASELATALGASKGSISSMTRLLMQFSLIERTSLPGDRRDYFYIRPEMWKAVVAKELGSVGALRQLAERGLTLLADAPPATRARLEMMRDIYGFFERELPALLERWEAHKREQNE